MIFDKKQRQTEAKKDPDYSTRRSLVKHEMKEANAKAPRFWKKSGARENLKLHYLTENDPRGFSKYSSKSKALSKLKK